jgi:ABC-2 type transport system permease protein
MSAIYGIVVRELARAYRQRGRLLAGLARPAMWLLLVGSGYNAIAHVDGVASYRAFIYPGIVVMATVFGSMLTAISTVYDREFGMLRLMLASPAGVPAVLVGRILAATIIGMAQGAVALLFCPLIVPVSGSQLTAAVGALILGATASSVLGLLIAARLQSVENFAGIINLVLFPLLFASGALYPIAQMPSGLRVVAIVNPVSYAVDLMRAALGQPSEFGVVRSMVVLAATAIIVFVAAAFAFDPEQRFALRPRRAKGEARADA